MLQRRPEHVGQGRYEDVGIPSHGGAEGAELAVESGLLGGTEGGRRMCGRLALPVEGFGGEFGDQVAWISH